MRRSCWFAMVVVAAMVARSTDASAGPKVWGCDVAQSPDDLKRCIEGKLNGRVDELQAEASRRLDDERKKADEQLKKTRDDLTKKLDALQLQVPQGVAELTTLAAVRELNLAPLFACLDRGGATAQLRDDVTRLARDPAASSRVIFQRTWDQLERNLDALIAEDLREIGSLKPPATVTKAASKAHDRMKTMLASTPALRCVAEHFDARAAAMQQTSTDLAAQVQARVTALYETKIRPQIERAAWKGLDAMLTQALAPPRGRATVSAGSSSTSRALEGSAGATDSATTPTTPAASGGAGPSLLTLLELDPEAIATRAYIAGLVLPRMEAITTRMVALERALAATPRVAATIATRAQELRDAFTADPGVTAVVEMEIGLEIIKQLGGKYIKFDGMIGPVPGGGVLWDASYAAFSLGIYFGYDVAVGSSGLIPEVGAYVFSAVRAVLEVTENTPGGTIVKKLLKQATLLAVTAAWGKLVDEVGAVMIRELGPGANAELQRVKAGNPTVAFLVDRLQRDAIMKLGASYLGRLKGSTRAYDAQVQLLLERAVAAP